MWLAILGLELKCSFQTINPSADLRSYFYVSMIILSIRYLKN